MVIPYVWMEMGHHALAWESTSSLRNGELWLNGGMEEREGEWLERQMVSRNSHRQHNDREMRSDLRVTPTPLFILFLDIFRVLSPWLGL